MSLDIAQPTTVAYDELLAIYNRTVETVDRRVSAGVGEPRDNATLQLRALAAMTLINYPDAVSFGLEASDQEGSDDMYVNMAFNDKGGTLAIPGDMFSGRWEDDMFELARDLWVWIKELPGVTKVDQNGTARVDIQILLDQTASLTPPVRTPEASAARGAEFLAKYKALTEYTADDSDAAIDLFVDLQHWAKQSDVDLDMVWAAAKQIISTDG